MAAGTVASCGIRGLMGIAVALSGGGRATLSLVRNLRATRQSHRAFTLPAKPGRHARTVRSR